ncbi:rhodanese-like domain-containing protein [Paenibacillus sp. 1011MAR3C5]|uniref:rhodanese-like domain-containing protein n=1 Tax=Paenibacillus sp. 1011MAR3C5 TaxID=1675787 RepID=UPI000E6C63B2|nr:rhodanese-like domain-containing protein [Paenibacillus sp. 1011MAR3C5]RJE90894.1 rhodanese-like domain-containing protein [Paenibacillus sp. 1011MAR3C5]
MDSATIINLLIAAVIGLFLWNRFGTARGLKNMSPIRFEQELSDHADALLIDVREPHEYQASHIPNAVNIPVSQLQDKLTEVPKDHKVLLYCQSGLRSRKAARILSKLGYRNMGHLSSGIMAWGGPLNTKK